MYPRMRKETLVVYFVPEETFIIETAFHPVKWGSFILRGLVALIIGILVFIWTGVAVQLVVTLIGFLIIIAAIFALVLAFKSPAGASGSGVLIVVGVLGLLVGIVSILYRGLAAEALTAIIALVMVFFGFIDLSITIFHPEYTNHKLLLGFTGGLSIILGGIFFFLPMLGAVVLVIVYLGIYAIIYGILSIITGVMVRKAQKKVTAG
jgi:uncharacterized membrane protein HdeD (DUF308 family)